MNSLAIVTMLVICGIVWGGFIALIARAICCEKAKERVDGQD